jgi:hypothetical protein
VQRWNLAIMTVKAAITKSDLTSMSRDITDCIKDYIKDVVTREIRDLTESVRVLSLQNSDNCKKTDHLLQENALLKEHLLTFMATAVRHDPVNENDENQNDSGDMFGEAEECYAAVARCGAKSKPKPTFSLPLNNKYALLSIMKEVALLDEKKHNAVVVGYPEQSDRGKATKDHDNTAISGFLRRSGVNMEDIVEIKRHGIERPNRHRPIKIFTRSEETRNIIMRSFWKDKPADAPKGSYCRRDMTSTELDEDRRLRTEAYKLNEDEGLRKWTVRDLKLFKLVGPNFEKWVARKREEEYK